MVIYHRFIDYREVHGRALWSPLGRLGFPWVFEIVSDGFRWLQGDPDGARLFPIMVYMYPNSIMIH